MKGMIPLSLLTLMLVVAACGEAPQVAQGVVVRYDADAKSLVLREDTAGGEEVMFSLQTADFGIEPAIGDTVRLAYRPEGGTKIALRVMNLSQQSELKKRGH
jgi:hypothetical protein